LKRFKIITNVSIESLHENKTQDFKNMQIEIDNIKKTLESFPKEYYDKLKNNNFIFKQYKYNYYSHLKNEFLNGVVKKEYNSHSVKFENLNGHLQESILRGLQNSEEFKNINLKLNSLRMRQDTKEEFIIQDKYLISFLETKLQCEIKTDTYNNDTSLYYLHFLKYIQGYFGEENVCAKKEIEREYIKLYETIYKVDVTSNSNVNRPPQLTETEMFSCQNCDSENTMVIDRKNAVLSCVDCGICVQYSDNSEQNVSYNDLLEISRPQVPMKYKRLDYFNSYLQNLESSYSVNIEEDIFDNIKKYLLTHNLIDVNFQNTNSIDYKLIKGILKSYNYTKYYKHIPQIIYRLTNKKIILSMNEKTKMRDLFSKICDTFENMEGDDKKRNNLISYRYVINKLFIYIGREDLLNIIPPLKDENKNKKLDIIWEKIIKELLQ
jgi:hypothetical protein